MSELVIGGNGFIGAHVVAATGANFTTRRHSGYFLDLLNFNKKDLPQADIVYFCAGVNGAMPCEGNPDAFRVNVDSTLEVISEYASRGAFCVWLSSQSLEWANTNYARTKIYTESVLRLNPKVGVVRAGRVTKDNIADLVEKIVSVGRGGKPGLHIWGTDKISYQK